MVGRLTLVGLLAARSAAQPLHQIMENARQDATAAADRRPRTGRIRIRPSNAGGARCAIVPQLPWMVGVVQEAAHPARRPHLPQ
jgi:hypothetical protein